MNETGGGRKSELPESHGPANYRTGEFTVQFLYGSPVEFRFNLLLTSAYTAQGIYGPGDPHATLEFDLFQPIVDGKVVSNPLFQNADSASAAEPGTWVMLLSGCVILWFTLRRVWPDLLYNSASRNGGEVYE